MAAAMIQDDRASSCRYRAAPCFTTAVISPLTISPAA